MWRFTRVVCMVGVCLGCWLLATGMPIAQSRFTDLSQSEMASDGGQGPVKKVAGVYLGTATGLGEPIHFLVTFERDGIFTASDTTDFGVGGIGGFDSDQHGIWRGTSSRQITARSLFLNHDSASGDLVAVVRNTWTFDFNREFTEGTGSIIVEVFAPFQVLDPLNPSTDEEPLGGTVAVDVTLARFD